jgi:hypothetical protein
MTGGSVRNLVPRQGAPGTLVPLDIGWNVVPNATTDFTGSPSSCQNLGKPYGSSEVDGQSAGFQCEYYSDARFDPPLANDVAYPHQDEDASDFGYPLVFKG